MKRAVAVIVMSAIILLLCSIPSAFAAEAGKNVYVASFGNDSSAYGCGTREKPYRTLSAAFRALEGKGGSIVIMDDISGTVLDASVTSLHATKEPVTVTGRDPETGTVYGSASVSVNSPRLYGKLTLEYVKLIPMRNYAFFNTYGNKIVFGEGITSSGYGLFVHSGGSGNMNTAGSSLEISSGAFDCVYLGGAFLTSSQYGALGDCTMDFHGGKLTNLYIGFDATGEKKFPGIIDGNVIIYYDGGVINKINTKNLLNNKISGFFALIMNDDLSVNPETVPDAAKGNYIVRVGKHGKVSATDTAGVFAVKPDTGYKAYINGEPVTGTDVTVKPGTSSVTFSRDKTIADYSGAVMFSAADGLFHPDDPASQSDALLSVMTAVCGKKMTDAADCFAMAEKENALPEGWTEENLSEGVTRAEYVYLLYTFFDTSCDIRHLFEYADVPKEHKYYEAVRESSSCGALCGYDGEMFYPDKKLSRAEMCVLINGFLKRKAFDGAKCDLPDIGGHPLYNDILCCVCGSEGKKWYVGENEYVFPQERTTENCITALYEQSGKLSGEKILDAIDVIAADTRKRILETKNTEKIYDLKKHGIKTVYYISEQNGSDENSGTSPDDAFKTPAALSGISVKKNFAVLFERGGIYRTGTSPISLSGTENVLFGCYGDESQNKPLLVQSRKNYADGKWTEVMPCVYRYDGGRFRNVGVMAFDHNVSDYSENTFDETYGIICNKYTQSFYGIEDMDTDLQFYCDIPSAVTEETVGNILTVTETFDRGKSGCLYLYSEKGNPSDRFSDIEIGECYDIFDGSAKSAIIDGLSLKFTGAHTIGLASSTDLSVTNCIFSWSGGSVLWEASRTRTYTVSGTNKTLTNDVIEQATCYGNAVEIYGSCDGFVVRNCWLYQIFDDGLTNQYTHDDIDVIQKNVRFWGNLIEYLYHSFSNTNEDAQKHPETDFETDGENAADDYTYDYIAAYNISRMAGYGWGGAMKERQDNGMLYRSNTPSRNKSEDVFYNIFDTSGGYITFESNSNEKFDSNIYVQILGHKMSHFDWKYTYTTTTELDRDIKELIEDKSPVVVLIKDEERAKKRMYEARLADTTEKGLSFVGAQIREDGVYGLRFIFSIRKELCEMLSDNAQLPDIGFGTVVLPEKYLSEESLTKETENVVSGKSYKAKTVKADRIFGTDAENGRVFFTVCITGIDDKKTNEKYVCVPYITYTENGNTVTRYGSVTKGISVSDVSAALEE